MYIILKKNPSKESRSNVKQSNRGRGISKKTWAKLVGWEVSRVKLFVFRLDL